MDGSRGNSLVETRKINRIWIKKAIFKNDIITRSDIYELSNLTLPTITTNIRDMIEEGILEEVPVIDKHKEGAGRKPVAVTFRAEYASVVGVELGPYSTWIVLTDTKGNVIEEKKIGIAEDNYKKMLLRLATHINKIIHGKKKILGVGIGLPGFIETNSGTIRSNPRNDWAGKRLSTDLESVLKLPVYIDNNVRLRALGYNMSAKNSGYDTFAYFYMSKGIACPLIIRNEIFSGFTSGSGEIGENVFLVEDKDERKGKALDELGSERAIFENCNRLIRDGKLSVKEKIGENEIENIFEVIDLQESNNKKIDEVVGNAIEYMGIALSHVVNLINPGLVVVDSCIFCREENRNKFKNSAKKYFFSLNEDEVKIVFVPYEANRGARGAAFYIIKKILLESDD